MPVPTNITDLSTTPAANSPAGSETPSLIDDYLRTQASFIATLRDEAKSRSFAVAAAGGTADAITATYSPAVTSLTNGMTLYVRAALANTTTSPTFSPNGLVATTIVRSNNQPLTAGDIAGAGHWLELQYDTTLSKWVLQNPARADLASVSYVDAAIYKPSAWINSDFGINQRALTTLADGAYGPDRTYALTQTASVGFSQLTAPSDGLPFAGRFTQTSATAQRFGFAQIVEAKSTYGYRGLDFVFSPKVRCSATATIRVAIVVHTGTADTLAKDVINDWASASYTAGGFFTSGLTVVAVSSVSCPAGVWTDVPVTGVVPSLANNVIMVCWTEGPAAQNFTLDASAIRAGRGRSAGLWLPPDPAQELVRCQRFYEKSYERGTVPGAATDVGAEEVRRWTASEGATFFNASFMTEKISVPVTTWYSITGTVNTIRNVSAGANVSVTSTAPTTKKVGDPSHAADGTAGQVLRGQWVSDAEIGT